MASNTYETLLILDSNHYARDPGGISTQLGEVFSNAGGNVLVNRLWMEQKLAYPIDKHQKGTYWLTYFEIDGVSLPKIDRALQLFEPVLRHMTIKLEPQLVELIVANARGESIKVSTPHDSAETGDEDSGAKEELVEV